MRLGSYPVFVGLELWGFQNIIFGSGVVMFELFGLGVLDFGPFCPSQVLGRPSPEPNPKDETQNLTTHLQPEFNEHLSPNSSIANPEP